MTKGGERDMSIPSDPANILTEWGFSERLKDKSRKVSVAAADPPV